MVFFIISQLFDAVDYSNYVFWVSETIIDSSIVSIKYFMFIYFNGS